METVDTLGLTYDLIYEAYNSFYNTDFIGKVTIGLKFLAIALFGLSVGTSMLNKIGNKWGVGEVDLPLDLNKVITSLIFVLIIAFYDKLLGFLDGLLIGMDTFYSNYDSVSLIDIQPEVVQMEDSMTWYQKLGVLADRLENFIRTLGDYANGLGILTGLLSVIDSIIYVVFLIERFFFLGLLKILGPIAILFSIYTSKRDMFFKWLKLYTATYLLIIPLYLVIGFTSQIIKTINENILNNSLSLVIPRRALLAVALITIIWVKLKLFRKSYDMVYKLMA